MNNSSSGLTCIDLFSGAGGLSYGFQEKGFEVLLGVDNDKKALETFKYNHRNSRVLHGDINQITADNIKSKTGKIEIDVIVGGPPCQGMSLSGPRKFDDPRNKLYLSLIRLVSDLEPKAVVIENVPGMVSLFKGQIQEAVIEKFTALGFKMVYEILRASDYGVPQHRRRVIFVGLLDREFKFPEPTHREGDSLSPFFTPMVTCKEALSDLPLLKNGLGEVIQEYPSPPLNSYQEQIRKDSKYIYNHIAAAHSQRIKDIISLVPPGKNYKTLPKHLQNTRKFNVAWTRFPENEPAPTIDTGHRHHFHYEANRVPTVRECARLQSFPDHFCFFGNKTEQFRQVGNAVPPILGRAIAKGIKEQL